jgi:hypothetical protein
MGIKAENEADVLRTYLQTPSGGSAPPELVERLRVALAPDCLGPLAQTVDHVHAVRMVLMQMDAITADQQRKRDEREEHEREHERQERRRELAERSLSETALSPATIAAIVAELVSVSDGDAIEAYWFERTVGNGGLALAGVNAARRAEHRLGSAWPVIDYLEKYLTPHLPAERANEARLLLARARQGDAAIDEDELEDHYEGADEESPLNRSIAKVEVLACDRVLHGEDTWFGAVAATVFEMTHMLATEVSRSCAAELVAGLEALGTGQRHEN